jgi:hypothetical protein
VEQREFFILNYDSGDFFKAKKMKRINNKTIFKISLLIIIVVLLQLSVNAQAQEPVVKEKKSEIPEFFVSPPPFSEGIFPCSQCHAGMKANPERRKLVFHTEISEGFDHAEENRWCLDCHNPDDRDKLRLASGKLVSFEESYDLCGQCHGTIFRDWKAGVHGKRTGMWNGKKQYRLCVHCHYPHWPKFQGFKPLPPPVNPVDIKYRKLSNDEIPLNPLGDNQDYEIPMGKKKQ